jgi:hypothetical protein
MPALLGALAKQQVRLVQVTQYDTDSLSTLWLRLDRHRQETEFVQLDLVYSLMGQHTYGFFSQPLVRARVQGSRWPTLAPIDNFLYLLRKRTVKGDNSAISSLLQLNAWSPQELEARASQIFRGRVYQQIRSYVRSAQPPAVQPAFLSLAISRLKRWDRLTYRSACWLDFYGRELPYILEILHSGFNHGLIGGIVGLPHRDDGRSNISRMQYMRSAGLSLWRPCLIVTVEAGILPISPDAVVRLSTHSDSWSIVEVTACALSDRARLVLDKLLAK